MVVLETHMISKFMDAHLNETCVIIGNGKSLLNVSNEWLDKYPTFGTNKIYLKYLPIYYCCTNPLILKQNREIIEMLDCVKFTRLGYIDSSNPLNISPVKDFSYHPYEWVYEGYTITFVAMQLAYYFGFTTVLLVGVDHYYQYDGKPNEEKMMQDDDPNHFDPFYFKGQAWNNPDLEKSEVSYNLAKVAFEKDGRRIINLTEGTKLDVFEKGNINDW